MNNTKYGWFDEENPKEKFYIYLPLNKGLWEQAEDLMEKNDSFMQWVKDRTIIRDYLECGTFNEKLSQLWRKRLV